jgi:glucan biosynthesis protein C
MTKLSGEASKIRFNNLDFLRAFALIIGVLLHSLSIYLEPADGSEPRPLAVILFIWIHSWRVPLFMLLAGFFTCLSLSKRNTGSYAINRLLRLGTPLVLLWLAIPAVDESASQMLKIPEGISWFTTGQEFTLRLDHLWFLYYLLIFYTLMLSIRSMSPQFFEKITNVKLNFITIVIVWLPLITLTTPWSRPIGGIFAEIPTTFGEVKIGSMLFMFAFFIIGMQVFNSQELLNRLQRKVFWLPSILCCSIIPIGLMAWGIMKDSPFTFSSSLEQWIICSMSTFASLFMVLGLIGISTKLITQTGPILTWVVRLSYTTYVFHITFVYSVGGYLLFAGVNAAIVVVCSFFAGIIGSVIIYYLLIKFTPLDWIFNGYKTSKFQIKSKTLNKFTNHL